MSGDIYAFPVSTIDGFTNEGMTLRDWFAGHALGIVKETYPAWQITAWFGQYASSITREHISAKAAYAMADAMIAERNTK